MVPLHC